MSIKLINPSKTKFINDDMPRHYNSDINVSLLLDGRAINEKTKVFINTNDNFNISFNNSEDKANTSFSALFCAMYNIKKVDRYKTVLINKKYGWLPTNVTHLSPQIIGLANKNQFFNGLIIICSQIQYNIVINMLSVMGYTNKTINYSDNILGVYFDSDGIISSYATKNKHAELSFNQICGLYTYHQSIHSKLTTNTQNDECDKDDDHYVNETYVKESVNENLPLIETDPIKSPEIKFTKLTLDDINIFKNNGVAFITEDFASFDTEEEANKHQDNVDKGKEAAEIIITRNGGHALAHEIYNLFVKYPNNKRPYEHFRHVLENNNGIKNQNKVDTYEFEDGNHLGKFRDQLLNKAFKKDDIIKISKSLVEINNCTNMINEILNHN